MAKNSEVGYESDSIGFSIFWILITGIIFSGIIYLAVWGIEENIFEAVAFAVVLSLYVLSGIIFSGLQIFKIGNWKNNSISFTLGALFWGSFVGIGSLVRDTAVSASTIGPNVFFSTIATQLPPIADWTINNIIVPFAEEMLWMVGLPFMLIAIMKQIGKKYEVFNNGILQLIIIFIVTASSFAIFHPQEREAFFYFILLLIALRSASILAILGDTKFDIFKKFTMTPAFALGMHMVNNTLDYGLPEAKLILFQSGNFLPIGAMVVILFGLIFATSTNSFLRLFFNDEPLEKNSI